MRAVGSIQEVSHIDILNYITSKNTNEESVDDSHTVYTAIVQGWKKFTDPMESGEELNRGTEVIK